MEAGIEPGSEQSAQPAKPEAAKVETFSCYGSSWQARILR